MTFCKALLLSCALSVPVLAAVPAVPASIPAWLEPTRDGKAFVSRMAQGSMVWTGTRASLEFDGSPENRPARLAWRLVDANSGAAVAGEKKLTSVSHYMRGSDRSEWRMRVPHYERARANAVYPGVDLVWYANGRLLEYDFIVAPGADPSPIRIAFDGGSAPSLSPEGDLLIETGGLTVRQHKPVVFQTIAGRRVDVDARYTIGENGVGFALGHYDRKHELIIDPSFSYAGFVGGSRLDVVNGVVMDAEGALWVTGSSQSELELPEEMPSYQKEKSGGRDAFLARILPGENGGGKLDYWTYIGGNGADEATAITIDKQGFIYLTGTTLSTNFPLGGSAYKTTVSGAGTEAFVVKFNPKVLDEFSLLYSSYFGQNDDVGGEFPQAVAVRDDGFIAIAGYSTSGKLPKMESTAIQPANRGGIDVFFAVFNPNADTADATLVESSFYGGASSEVANAVGWDSKGRLVLAGSTMSEDFPTAGAAYQAVPRGGDAFIAVFDFNKTGLDRIDYATYLGGWRNDVATAMQIDSNDLIWLTGYTLSDDFPTSTGAPQRSLSGVSDAFLLAADITKSGADFLPYSTLFGGSAAEVSYGLALEPRGTVTIVGYSNSHIFPTKNPLFSPPLTVKLTEAFYASFNPAVSGPDGLVWAMQHGGSGTDVATSVFADAHGNLAVAGFTTSFDLPTAAPTGKQNPAGLYTGWFMRLNADQQ